MQIVCLISYIELQGGLTSEGTLVGKKYLGPKIYGIIRMVDLLITFDVEKGYAIRTFYNPLISINNPNNRGYSKEKSENQNKLHWRNMHLRSRN